MGLKSDIEEKIDEYLTSKYETSNATVVPDKQSIIFGPEAKNLSAIVMYIDMRGSRALLSQHSALSAARAHKAFLFAASKCIRNENGYLRSFNGDSDPTPIIKAIYE